MERTAQLWHILSRMDTEPTYDRQSDNPKSQI